MPAMASHTASQSRFSLDGSSKSQSNGIPQRSSSASTSTLPSIRSLRKAFQFSNSNNKHHSVDGHTSSSSSSADPFKRSIGTRTFSGTVTIPTDNQLFKNVITKSSSASALTGSGTTAPDSSSHSTGDSKNVNTSNNRSGLGLQQHGRPTSMHAVIPENMLVSSQQQYNSSIPVKTSHSRPASISSSTIRSSSSRLDIKLQPSPPLPVVEDTSPRSSTAQLDIPLVTIQQEKVNVDKNEEDTSIMYIKNGQGSTPPPVIPLPPIPKEASINERQTLPARSNGATSFPTAISKKKQALSSSNRNSLEVPFPTTRLREASSSSSLLDETAPEALHHLDDTSSISSPPAHITSFSSRPGITRSRSALESIKAIAAEADMLLYNDDIPTSSSDGGTMSTSVSRSRQSSIPKPVIMESPSRSPAVMDASNAFKFPPSSSAESFIASTHSPVSAEFVIDGEASSASQSNGRKQANGSRQGSAGSPTTEMNNSTYLRGLRHSSTSPLSELVQRLNVQSPIRDGHTSPNSYLPDMDTSDLRSEEDPSEAHYLRNEGDQEGHNGTSVDTNGDGYDSPFIPHNMMMGDEHDQNSVMDDGSVEGSSGISAAPPGRIPTSLLLEQTGTRAQEQRSFEKLSARKSSGNESLSRSGSQSKERSKTLREFENKISPQTEKRWSMAEVEAAYGRIRRLATRRSSAAVSEAPSFLISEDSKDIPPSYVQHLIDRGYPLDTSILSSGTSHAPSPIASDIDQHIGRHRLPYAAIMSNDGENHVDEEGDALTPLVGRDRYSPSTSPRLSPRALSPNLSNGQFPNRKRSPRNSYIGDARAESPSYSSGGTTGSSSRDKSGESAALTAPTSARQSQEGGRGSEAKLIGGHNAIATVTAPPILRSVSDQQNERSSSAAKLVNGGDRNKAAWRRRASAEASSAASSGAASDDTGWVTPKTSAGDVLGRRRSVSPALTATRRGSSAMDHYDETPHHTTTALPVGANARRASSTRHRRPVSYSSSGGTDSIPGASNGRSGSFRYTHGPSHSASHSSLWFDDTPKAAVKARPSIPTDFRGINGGAAAHPHRREASSYSTTGSTYSLDSLATSSFAEAKRADKIDLFLRCTKAEAALQAISAHSQIEREALLDALQESRSMIDALRHQNEELIEQLEYMRRHGNRKVQAQEQSQEAARRVAEIVEARDEWQARAQAMERDLAATKQAQRKTAADSEAALSNMRLEISRLHEQLSASTKVPPKSPPRTLPRAASSLPKKASPGSSYANSTLKKSTSSPSGLPRSTNTTSKSALPRSRQSSGTNSISFSPHGRTQSNASSTFQTDFGDHLPASSDAWSLGDSQDASLRLDDSTARFLQDIEGQPNRARQKSTTSSH